MVFGYLKKPNVETNNLNFLQETHFPKTDIRKCEDEFKSNLFCSWIYKILTGSRSLLLNKKVELETKKLGRIFFCVCHITVCYFKSFHYTISATSHFDLLGRRKEIIYQIFLILSLSYR